MTRFLLGLCAVLLTVPASAQPGGGPPGGGPPGGGHPGGGPPRMREIKPVTRERYDAIVADMFRTADSDRNGLVATEEVRAIANARRDVLIGKRFARIDTDNDRTINRDEFFAWQKGLGSVAESEEAQAIGRGGLVPETIAPDYRDDMEARLLAGILEPLSVTLVASANSNYDAGLSLDELKAYEGKRFEAADRDRNNAITMGEAKQPEGRLPGGVMGLPPGRPAEPPPGNE